MDTKSRFNCSRIYPLLLSFVIVVMFACAGTAFATSISVTPSFQAVLVGDLVQVKLDVADIPVNTAVAGYGFRLQYDPTILTFSSVSFGDPALSTFLDYNQGYNENYSTLPSYNAVHVFGGASGILSKTELIALQPQDITLATFFFNAVAPGTSLLHVQPGIEFLEGPNSSGSSGGPGFTSSSDIFHGSVQVTAVPVPASLFLLASGLSALVGLRRKQ